MKGLKGMEKSGLSVSWTGEISILATTKMYNGVCVAGLDSDLDWTRPVKQPGFNLQRSDLRRLGKVVIENYNQVEFLFTRRLENKPHSEDVAVDWSRKPKLRGRLAEDEVFELLNDTDETPNVGSSIKRFLVSGKRSLVNVRPDGPIEGYMERKPYGRVQRRMKFCVNRADYDIPCTDLRWRALTRGGEEAVEGVLEDAEDLILTIGLTRIHLRKYWPLVLTVHTHPSYEVEVDYDRL
jgi:hypothetical protein